jgi:maltooligosyltrehalose trehalohydrolase
MFFAEHNEELRKVAHSGRRKFVSQFRAYADKAVQTMIPDPGAETTFKSSKLDWQEVHTHADALAFHRDLLTLRRTDKVFAHPESFHLDGATLSEWAFVLRWFTDEGEDRLLIVNLHRELWFESIAEPLVAPPRGKQWELAWSSEEARYGGQGVISPIEDGGRGRWCLAAQSSTLLATTLSSSSSLKSE